MDSKFSGPLGFKFGLDGLLGVVPIVGDFFGSAVSLYIIYEAAMLGCGPSVLMRMGLNVFIESLIEMIPLLGNIFDFVWKANDKNIVLLETHLLNPKGATVQARLVLGFIALVLIGIFVGSIAITIFIFKHFL